MRLTLRTLLAFMDDILEREDAQDIAKKVQESDRASQLLHRIREVIQRARLAAPEATEFEASLDPNTVAEYLDNTLSGDRVLDFEKVCLDSDVQLAEVASCHQILTLVLGEPAEVDPDSRLRMYQIAQEVAASETIAGAASPEETHSGPLSLGELTTVEPRESAHVPAYLRQSPVKRWWLDAVLVVLGVTVVVGALWVMGQLNRGTRLGDFLAGGKLTAEPAPPAKVLPEVPVGTTKAAAGPVSEVRQPAEVAVTELPAVTSGPTAPAAPLPPKAGQAGVATPVTAAPVSVSSLVPPAVSTGSAGPAGSVSPEKAARTPGPETVATSVPAGSASKPPLVAAGKSPAPTAPLPGESKATPAAVPGRPGESAPVPPTSAGKYISASEVLVRLNPQAAVWSRVPAQAALHVGDQVLSFPTYRPAIALAGGANLQLFDGTRVTFESLDGEGVLQIGVSYGRLVLKPVQQQKTRVRLKIGDRVSTLRLEDSGTEVKLEVGRPVATSTDPETQPAPLVAEFYVTSGKVLWQEGASQEPLAIAAPAKFRWEEGPPQAVAFEKPPAWDAAQAVGLLDQRASASVERSLEMDRSVGLSLRELADRRQREIRWLAMCCLGYLGDFDVMALALNDPEQKLFWQDYVEQLRLALARGPESAGAVRTSLEKLYQSDGTSLYELLWKYRKHELEPLEAKQLVQYLDHEVLAVRVLAFGDLYEITGFKLAYRPEYPAAKRLPLVQKWRERMGIGQQREAPAQPGAAGGADLPVAPLPKE